MIVEPVPRATFRVCAMCVMDTSDSDITFDENGVCNHCRQAAEVIDNFKYKDGEDSSLQAELDKCRGSGARYDCLIGLSGGVDSSYVAMLAHQNGLNPLCVHFDNSWNGVISVKNIKKIIDKTGWDFETYVIQWPEFRSLQRAYFLAGVVDIEVCTDHAIFATMIQIARREGIKFVLSGTNFATEHGMPSSWSWHKTDLANLKDINRKFGEVSLKNYPTLSTLNWLLIRKFGIGVRFLEPLNKIPFERRSATMELENYFKWESYGEKHHESVFTRFYQEYVLPRKFKIDKRKVFLSAAIRMGAASRNEALLLLQAESMPEQELLSDKKYVLSKLGFDEQQFDSIMNDEPKSHTCYKTDRWYIDRLLKWAKRLGIKRFYEED